MDKTTNIQYTIVEITQSDDESDDESDDTELNDSENEEKDIEDIGVNTEPMKRPCYFLYNKGFCKFADQECKFSHAFDCENFEN